MKPPPAGELQFVSDTIALWHTFERSVKADLFSTALSTPRATFLVDPIPLDSDSLDLLQRRAPIGAIIISNQNHWRSAAEIGAALSVPILAHPDAQLSEVSPAFTLLADGQQVTDAVAIIAIDGAAPGEIAIFSERDGGILIVGDALINFGPYGFTFLPAKYCTDHRKMKQSLRRLLPFHFESIFFAHGSPILSGADTRLRSLVDQE